jgi:hypothetical protein
MPPAAVAVNVTGVPVVTGDDTLVVNVVTVRSSVTLNGSEPFQSSHLALEPALRTQTCIT